MLSIGKLSNCFHDQAGAERVRKVKQNDRQDSGMWFGGE